MGEDLIRRKLANWERFLHGSPELDPLVRLAIQHYQFEAIHPFEDGNGRTGRIINVLYLIDQGLLSKPILYLSREILSTRDLYYDCLADVTREGTWAQWIEYMLIAVATSASRTQTRVRQFRSLMLHTEIFLRKKAPKLASKELLDIIFMQPYCRIKNVVAAGIAKRQTAATYLKALSRAGVLEEIKIGRDVVYFHTKLAQLLAGDHAAITRYGEDWPSTQRLLFPDTDD